MAPETSTHRIEQLEDQFSDIDSFIAFKVDQVVDRAIIAPISSLRQSFEGSIVGRAT